MHFSKCSYASRLLLANFNRRFLSLSNSALQTDHYKILGVDQNATTEEIKRAYLKLCKEYHPDKHQGRKAMHEKFVAVNEAYSILSNISDRSEYDLQRNRHSYGSYQSQSPYGWKATDERSGPEDVFRQRAWRHEHEMRSKYYRNDDKQDHPEWKKDTAYTYWDRVYNASQNRWNQNKGFESRQKFDMRDPSSHAKISQVEKRLILMFWVLLVFIIFFRIFMVLKNLKHSNTNSNQVYECDASSANSVITDIKSDKKTSDFHCQTESDNILIIEDAENNVAKTQDMDDTVTFKAASEVGDKDYNDGINDVRSTDDLTVKIEKAFVVAVSDDENKDGRSNEDLVVKKEKANGIDVGDVESDKKQTKDDLTSSREDASVIGDGRDDTSIEPSGDILTSKMENARMIEEDEDIEKQFKDVQMLPVSVNVIIDNV